jgi:hypothetical protein
MTQLSDIFTSIAAISAAGIVISEFLDKFGWQLSGVWAQVRSIGVTVVLSTVGAVTSLGMFQDPATCGTNAWYVCGPVIGAVAGLISNWAFMTPLGQFLLEKLGLKPKQA